MDFSGERSPMVNATAEGQDRWQSTTLDIDKINNNNDESNNN